MRDTVPPAGGIWQMVSPFLHGCTPSCKCCAMAGEGGGCGGDGVSFSRAAVSSESHREILAVTGQVWFASNSHSESDGREFLGLGTDT